MFLKQMRQKDGRVRLAVYESYRSGGRTRQRTVESLGYLDELRAEHADPVAWGRELAARMTEERRASVQRVQVDVHPGQKIDKRADGKKNIGCAAALAVYSGLGIERALRNSSRGSAARYDLNAVMRLLVCERLLEPGSKLAAHRRRGRYFFRSDFTDDDVYRALDGLAAAKPHVISAMNRAVAAAGPRDTSTVYYDVTNYYFETDGQDGLRRRGASKEHRPNPIVQMGLLQDARGVPIAYSKFPGSTPDCLTMVPVLEQMKRDHGLGRVVCVADKGLNCSANIAAAVAAGDGFVFSQSVRGSKSDAALKAWVVDERGYAGPGDGGFRCKSRQGHKTVHLKAGDTADGRPRDVRVDVKYVAFWSGKYERRARAERERVIEKARDLIARPGAYTRATGYGAARYVRNVAFDGETGEVVPGRALSLDEEAIREDERYDGYYLIVTSETDWPDARIIDAYRELWRIEESFRITKSELGTRPVYVRTPEHIEAHLLVCYVALAILRILQAATGLPCSTIRSEMAEMEGVNFGANWWAFGHRSDASDLIADTLGIEELKLRCMTTQTARKILAKAAKAELPHG